MFAGLNRSSTAKLFSSKAMCGQQNPFETQMSPTETMKGDFWMIQRGSEHWPVVICEESIVETYFKKKGRPENARQADGKWNKAYGSGGLDKDNKCFPAVFLGTWQLTWAPAMRLEHIDEGYSRTILETTENTTLALAWRDYEHHFRDEDPLDYCKDHFRQQQLGKAESKNTRAGSKAPPSFKMPPTFKMPAAGKMPEKRKRKGTPTPKYPPGYIRDEVDDEESEDLFLRPGAEPTIKNEFSNSSSSAEADAMFDDLDPPIPVRGGQQSKRSKTDMSGRFSTRPNTPGGYSTMSMTGSPSAARKARAASKFPVKKHKDLDRVIIYVGNPHTQYRAKLANLDISPLLKQFVAHHPDNGWYVMSPMLSQLESVDFFPIGQYLTRREYEPNILDDGTEFVRLEGELTDYARGLEVVRCGTIYVTAQMLELPGLQDLAFRKLRALEKQEPFQAGAILTVVEMVFDKANEDLSQYLVQYMADHYWDLVLAETAKIAEVMKDNEELAQGVFGLLCGRPEAEIKVENENEVKMKEEAKAVKKEKEEMKIFGDDTEMDTGTAKEQEITIPSALGDDFELISDEGNPAAPAAPSIFGDGPWKKELTAELVTRIKEEQPGFFEPYTPCERASMEI